MAEAKISEIFLSYQGEGLFAGSRQLFVRFFGCNLKCFYCDTPLESYKSFTREALLGKILDFDDDYNELTLTGGEPLLYADFLKDFLPLFKKHRQHKVYLESNGTLPDELKKVIDSMDIISMDIKLPSSAQTIDNFWDEHKNFMEVAQGKELIIKAVVTDDTTIDDIKKMSEVISGIKEKVPVILQPVTPINEDVKEPDHEMISFFKLYLNKETGKDVRILGQVHKCLGVK